MTKGEAYDKGVRKDQYTGSYGEFKPQHVKSDGERYPNDVVFFEEDHDDFVYVKTAESEGEVYHPTQKPVELGRYLIRTFSNPGISFWIMLAAAAASCYRPFWKTEVLSE